jgi:hypothetical protein
MAISHSCNHLQASPQISYQWFWYLLPDQQSLFLATTFQNTPPIMSPAILAPIPNLANPQNFSSSPIWLCFDFGAHSRTPWPLLRPTAVQGNHPMPAARGEMALFAYKHEFARDELVSDLVSSGFHLFTRFSG